MNTTAHFQSNEALGLTARASCRLSTCAARLFSKSHPPSHRSLRSPRS